MISKAEFDKLMAEKPSQRLANALIALDVFESKVGCEVDMDFYYSYNTKNWYLLCMLRRCRRTGATRHR